VLRVVRPETEEEPSGSSTGWWRKRGAIFSAKEDYSRTKFFKNIPSGNNRKCP
jgi:hypothetical protein